MVHRVLRDRVKTRRVDQQNSNSAPTGSRERVDTGLVKLQGLRAWPPGGGQLFDRLVGGSVLPDTDGVVGVEVDDRQFHQRGQPQGAALEVGEDQEPGLVGGTLLRARPLAMARAACSRTPKCRFRPARSSGEKSPERSKVSRDLLEGGQV